MFETYWILNETSKLKRIWCYTKQNFWFRKEIIFNNQIPVSTIFKFTIRKCFFSNYRQLENNAVQCKTGNDAPSKCSTICHIKWISHFVFWKELNYNSIFDVSFKIYWVDKTRWKYYLLHLLTSALNKLQQNI